MKRSALTHLTFLCLILTLCCLPTITLAQSQAPSAQIAPNRGKDTAARLQAVLPHPAPGGESATVTAQHIQKLSTTLQALLTADIEDHSGVAKARAADIQVADDSTILVHVVVRGDQAAATTAIANSGLRVTLADVPGAVEGFIRIPDILTVAALPQVRAVSEVLRPRGDIGSATSQGDAAMSAAAARATGATGSGVPLGIISDSINRAGSGVAGSKALGDLPPQVSVADSERSRTRVPIEAEHPFRAIPNTDSDGSRTLIPSEAEHG